jgi:hypothetical protein
MWIESSVAMIMPLALSWLSKVWYSLIVTRLSLFPVCAFHLERRIPIFHLYGGPLALPVLIKMRNLVSVPGFGKHHIPPNTGLGLRDQCDTLTAITSALCPPTPDYLYLPPLRPSRGLCLKCQAGAFRPRATIY